MKETVRRMSSSVVVLVAKAGDVVSFLPVARHLFQTEGVAPLWIVHRLYLSILLSVSYVQAVPVTFAITRTDLALKLAHTKSERVINATCHGKAWKGRRDLSYNQLAWESNGFGEHFHDTVNWPLVLDKRSADRESLLCQNYFTDERPVLLLHIGCGKSSPFREHALFSDGIRRKWAKRFKIVDLCEVNAVRLYDCCALLEKAALLITTDSVFLHLATVAPKLRVICLVNDNPFLASEPRYQPLFKCRYADALANLPQIHEKIISIL